MTLVRNPICVVCKKSHFAHSTEGVKYCKSQMAKSRIMLPRDHFSDSVKQEILERQQGRCIRCNEYMIKVEFHHIGGRWGNDVENGAAMHPQCHKEITYGNDFL